MRFFFDGHGDYVFVGLEGCRGCYLLSPVRFFLVCFVIICAVAVFRLMYTNCEYVEKKLIIISSSMFLSALLPAKITLFIIFSIPMVVY